MEVVFVDLMDYPLRNTMKKMVLQVILLPILLQIIMVIFGLHLLGVELPNTMVENLLFFLKMMAL
jgi:hypothetical protein